MGSELVQTKQGGHGGILILPDVFSDGVTIVDVVVAAAAVDVTVVATMLTALDDDNGVGDGGGGSGDLP